jgi:hypothetical protein
MVLIGTVLYFSTVITVLGKISLENQNFTFVYWMTLTLTGLALFSWMFFISFIPIPTANLLGMVSIMFESSPAMLNIFLTPLAGIMVSAIMLFSYTLFYPTMADRHRTKAYVSSSYHRLYRFGTYHTDIGAVYNESEDWKEREVGNAYEINKRTLHFKAEGIEKTYKMQSIESHITVTRNVIRILFLLFCIWVAVEISLLDSSLELVTTRIVLGGLVLVVVIYSSFDHYSKHYVLVTGIVILGIIVSKFIFEISFGRQGGLTSALLPMMTYVLFNIDWLIVTWLNSLHILFMMLSSVVFCFVQEYDAFEIIAVVTYITVLITAITITSALIGYWLEKAERKEYTLFKKAENEIAEA